jgi:MHS family proline/betaine transporter-like MFS transporter
MASSVGLGVTLGSCITWIIASLLNKSQMFAWGFRIPFFFGSIVAVVGFIIRKHLPETLVFLNTQNSSVSSSLFAIFQIKHLKKILIATGIMIFPASLVTFFLVLPVYLHDTYNYEFPNIYLVTTIGHFCTTIFIPLFGWISDKYIARKFLLFLSICFFIVFGFPIFSLLQLGTLWALVLFVLLYQTIISAMASCYFALLPEIFPSQIRYTGTSFSYNIAYTLAASIPLLATYIYEVLKKPFYLVGWFIILAMIAAWSISSHSKNP